MCKNVINLAYLRRYNGVDKFMTYDELKEKAVYLKHNGYNCAQAVMQVYKEYLNLTDSQINAIASGFGSGMGSMKATCGALVGANMVLGLLNNTDTKTKFISRDMSLEFIKRSKAISCEDLKGVKTHQVLTSCEDCICNAIDILNETLQKHNIIM